VIGQLIDAGDQRVDDMLGRALGAQPANSR
jgi:hypothetical protein